MTEKIDVAVIMPYHLGMFDYMKKSIESIYKQDTGKSISLILVDNDVTGSTYTVVEEYLATLPNFNAVHLRMSVPGVTHARNLALEWIESVQREGCVIDYVAFCDCDDVWHWNHIEAATNFLDDNECDMVYSDVDVVDENDRVLNVYGIPYYDIFDRTNLEKQNFIFISSVVMRSDVAVKYRFVQETDPMGDWDMWLSVSKDHRVSHIKNKTVRYLWKTESGSYYNDKNMIDAAHRVRARHGLIDDVPGWLSDMEQEMLKHYARDCDCLEVGSYKGKSANCIASVATSLACVDTFMCQDDGQSQGTKNILPNFLNNTRKYSDKITPIVGDSKKVHHNIADDNYDFLFIDAMHDYESVRTDIINYWPKLKIGGTLILHDYNNNDYPGVKRAATELLGDCVSSVDSIAIYKKGEAGLCVKSKMGIKVLISPFAKKMPNDEPNPKNPPLNFWIDLVKKMRESGIHTVQVGIAGEPLIGADEICFNFLPGNLKKILDDASFFISVDSFFQHFATFHGKKGIVIFSQSDPEIFGHLSNINILKSKSYLRQNQFNLWTQSPYNADAFPDVGNVFTEVSKLIEKLGIYN